MVKINYSKKDQNNAFGKSFADISDSNATDLKQYLKAHRLNASQEYQLIVNLIFNMEDEKKAKKLITDYICDYGLNSQAAKKVLSDMGYSEALMALHVYNISHFSDDGLPPDLCVEKSVNQRLQDGFDMMLHN